MNRIFKGYFNGIINAKHYGVRVQWKNENTEYETLSEFYTPTEADKYISYLEDMYGAIISTEKVKFY